MNEINGADRTIFAPRLGHALFSDQRLRSVSRYSSKKRCTYQWIQGSAALCTFPVDDREWRKG